MNQFLKILNNIAMILRKILGPALAALVLYLIFFVLLPWLLGLILTKGAAAYAVLAIFILFLVILIVLWIRDKGKMGIGGCVMRVHYMRPDVCVNVSCAAPGKCQSTKGPYPARMGSWTPFTQDITCICSNTLTSGLGGLPQYLQDAINKALAVKSEEDIRTLLLQIMMKEGIQSDKLPRIYELLKKKQSGQDLTPEEEEELVKLLRREE
jgi:hypothetical protein